MVDCRAVFHVLILIVRIRGMLLVDCLVNVFIYVYCIHCSHSRTAYLLGLYY
jgi:hypothetical protein